MSAKESRSITISSLGDSAITVRFGEEINQKVHEMVQTAARYFEDHPFKGFIECVASFTSITLFYDPWVVYKDSKQAPFEWVKSNIEESLDKMPGSLESTARTIRIPVCYGGRFGPDLQEVAASNGLRDDEVIDIHTNGEYTVYMIGFAPGFPFLGGLDEKIAAPRRSSPRTSIPKGSVGIAGKQTGVYPISTPGGWQLIGQTPLALFRPLSEPPSLLQAGDIVKFHPISEEEFLAYEEEEGA
ncbi:5-oxoprolinase subunit PxpB [Bacillus gobiensis]|uniref:5-oxoprolinase subunit PxpB n=1 Tax=Bacillus gobiensis TaxID=1441095 RepID=UPI003D245985